MSRIERIDLGNGDIWGVGFDVVSRADVIVPIDCLSGVTVGEIGATVLALVRDAVALEAFEYLDYWESYVDRWDRNEVFQLLERFEPYQGTSDEVDELLPLLREIAERKQRAFIGEILIKERQRKRRIGYVYLAKCSTGHYKIGISKTPDARVRSLSTQMPLPVTLAHTFPADDMRAAEKILHEMFSKNRTSGEWFELGRDDVAFIVGITAFKDGCFLNNGHTGSEQ